MSRSTSTSLRRGEPIDPFEALVDNKPRVGSWDARPVDAVRAGGAIAQGVDSPAPDRPAARGRHRRGGRLDQAGLVSVSRIARPSASGPISTSPCPKITTASPRPARRSTDCCTHFVSTHAYAHHPSVLDDLRQHDTQSHGHFHHVYREPEANRRQPGACPPDPLELGIRARRLRRRRTAAGGRSLDDQLEDLGYLYSSDFQLGHDDFPFYPWKGNRFSRILQIPIHPVCEGLFLEAGVADPAIDRRLFPAGRRREARRGRARRRLRPSRAQAGPDARGHAALARGDRRPAPGLAGNVLGAGALVAMAGRAVVAGHPSRGPPPRDPVRRVGHRIRTLPLRSIAAASIARCP